MTVHKKRKK